METISTIKVGDVIRTNYGTGPYEVTEVRGPFTEPSFVDSLNKGKDAPMSPPYFCYTCRPKGSSKKADCYLNGYDGATHKNVWRDDRIITQEEDQLPLLIILM